MDLRPMNCFETDDLCKFEMFGLANTSMVPVMIAMAPNINQNFNSDSSAPTKLPTLHENSIQNNLGIQPTQYIPSSLLLPTTITNEQIQNVEYPISSVGSGIIYHKIPFGVNSCPRHKHLINRKYTDDKHKYMETIEEQCTDSAGSDSTGVSTCIPGLNLGGTLSWRNENQRESEDCTTVGCNALMMVGIGSGGGGSGSSSNLGRSDNNPLRFGYGHHTCDDDVNNEISNIKHQPCNCSYMSFDNLSHEFQVRTYSSIIRN